MPRQQADMDLEKIARVIQRMADPDTSGAGVVRPGGEGYGATSDVVRRHRGGVVVETQRNFTNLPAC